jgi:hypothetical protein
MSPHRLLPLALCAALAAVAPASADTLLIERVGAEAGMTLPARGQRMADVERKYGAPTERLAPVGGQKKQWPAIHRWTYPNFVVYFEKGRVIDAVAVRASAGETGPKPVTP